MARSQQLFSVRKCSVLQNNHEAEVNYVLVCGVLLVVSLFEHFWRPSSGSPWCTMDVNILMLIAGTANTCHLLNYSDVDVHCGLY